MKLQGGNGYDLFLQAMAHSQLAFREEAQRAYDLGIQWMEKHKPTDPSLRGLQTEAKAALEADPHPGPLQAPFPGPLPSLVKDAVSVLSGAMTIFHTRRHSFASPPTKEPGWAAASEG
jgi:hypothetical protein